MYLVVKDVWAKEVASSSSVLTPGTSLFPLAEHLSNFATENKSDLFSKNNISQQSLNCCHRFIIRLIGPLQPYVSHQSK